MRIIILLVVGLLALSTSAYALYDEPLIENGCFDQGSTGWEASEAVQFNAGTGVDVFGRPDIAYDPWPYPIPGDQPSGYLRQIIDNSKSPFWNPNLNHKIETVTFELYTAGAGHIQVGFDWWDTFDSTKPVGSAPYWEILPTQYYSPNEWTTVSVTFDWLGKPGSQQPRWTSIEIYFYGCSGTGNEAGVDNIVVTSQCVPEPSSLLVLGGSLLGLAGAAWRRRS